MSHFTRLKTKITEKAYLLEALRDLEYSPEEGNVRIRGYAGNEVNAEVRVPATQGYDIGFVRQGDFYECVADWYGIRMNRQQFVQRLTQRYAYHAAREKLQAQGFGLVEEEEEDGQIRLTMRRAH